LERYANGVTTSLLTSNGSVFDGFGAVSLNNNGSFAFLGRLDSSFATGPTGAVEGIFVGTNPITDAALLEGDALFGGTLRDVGFGLNGFNDLGQFTFFYELTDGRTGIGLATVTSQAVGAPEAGTAVLVGLGLLLLGGVFGIRRRRK
jgi:MYXO-CTERM domain-containing protein